MPGSAGLPTCVKLASAIGKAAEKYPVLHGANTLFLIARPSSECDLNFVRHPSGMPRFAMEVTLHDHDGTKLIIPSINPRALFIAMYHDGVNMGYATLYVGDAFSIFRDRLNKLIPRLAQEVMQILTKAA